MKIIINKKHLNPPLQLATSVLDAKPALETLTGILIEAKNDTVTITASDSNLSTKLFIRGRAVIEEEGVVLLEGKTFAGAISKLDGDITIEKLRANIRITNGVAEYKLRSIDVNLYPQIDFTISENEFSINGNDFNHALSKVVNSTSNTDERPIFSGVNFLSKDDRLEFIATDGYRLSKTHVQLQEEAQVSAVVLSDTLKTVMKIAKDQNLHISTSSNKVTFRTDNALFITRVIDGVYPDVERLIPVTFNTQVFVDRARLKEAVDRSSFVKENNIWALNLDFSHGILKLVTEADDVGSTYEEVDIRLEGSEVKLTLNGQFLTNALNALEDEEISFNLNGSLQALTVSDSTDQVQLLLPIRTA